MLCVDVGQPERAAGHLEYCRKILVQEEDWLGRAGAVFRAEGAVAAAQHRFSESDRHFEKAIEIYKQYSLPWDEAETLHYWGKALLKAGQRQGAREKLDAAIKIYRDYGSGPSWIDRVEADRRRAQPAPGGAPPQTGLASAAAAPQKGGSGIRGDGEVDNVFHCEGDIWTITYEGQTLRLKDFKGLSYITLLLQHPGEEFHAVSLVSGVDSANSAEDSEAGTELGAMSREQLAERHLRAGRSEDAGEMLDAQARAEYGHKLKQLREELEEAQEFRNSQRIAKAEDEIEALSRELSRAVGRGGRDRRAGSASERARLSATHAIKMAIERVAQKHSRLAVHLSASIRTGTFCCYRPDPSSDTAWHF